MQATLEEIKRCGCYRDFVAAPARERSVLLMQLSTMPVWTVLKCGHVLGTETLPALSTAQRELNRLPQPSTNDRTLVRNQWPYSSLVDPLGDFSEHEELAVMGGTNHSYALDDPNYCCECEYCAPRRGTHEDDCSCRLCLALFEEEDTVSITAMRPDRPRSARNRRNLR